MNLLKHILIGFFLIFFVRESKAQCSSSFTQSSTGFTTTFTNTSVGTSPTTTYFWSFGDGNTSNLQNPVHTYASAGTYYAGVEIRDTASGGCFDSVYNFVTVNSTSGCTLTASFTQSSSGLTASFVNTTTGITSAPFYNWHFGDGNQSNLQNPTHTYTSPGTYNMDLIVWDSSGCTDTAYSTIIITSTSTGCPLSASFTNSSSGSTTNFVSTSTGTSSTTTYFWDFGDGNTSVLQNPIHSYTYENYYNVSLIISDSSCSDSVTYLILVGCPIHADILDSLLAPKNYLFLNPLRGTQSSLTTFQWSFGDGNTSTSQFPMHTYASTGTYTVCLIKTDPTVGCADTVCKTIVVSGTSGCALIASYTQSSSGLTASFINTTSGITSTPFYVWHFGDGNQSNLENPTHTYTSAGTYNVDLMVFDSSGCSDTAYSTIVIVGPSVSCHINASFVETITGLSVGFNSTTTSSLSLPISYNWQFGDGNLGSGATSTHSYSSTGVYSVTIIASDSLCSDSNTRIIAVSSNVYTPNGDGIDDVFPLPCSGVAATVYNSSGTLIKTLAPGTTSWDGTNNLGGNEPTGLYFILCSGSSTPVPVTLIR